MCEALGMRIGVLGGTGPAGQGIALRLTSLVVLSVFSALVATRAFRSYQRSA